MTFILPTLNVKINLMDTYGNITPYSALSKPELTLSDPMSGVVRKYDFPVPLRCRKTSDTVFVAFVRLLSEPIQHFSSCGMDFSQQIAQVVVFLFLYVFLFQNCRIITSNPPTSFSPKTSKGWGVCWRQKNWSGKG